VSRCEDFPTFQELTTSPISGCAGTAHPEDGDIVPETSKIPSHPDADLPKKTSLYVRFSHYIMSLNVQYQMTISL